jgi:hypothetical protein
MVKISSDLNCCAQSKGETLLYCHSSDMVYYTNPEIWLGDAVPNETALLCQWCEDKGGEQSVPRLLVFDLVGTKELDVAARGAKLRHLSVAFPSSTYVLQWSGELGALKQFVNSLPHPVDYLIRIGDNPCLLEKHIDLNVQTKTH